MHEFIKEMEMAYAAADIIISRAGAMSVTEICVAGKPVVLLCLFHMRRKITRHRMQMYLVKKQAALIVKDSEAKEKLVNTVIALSKDAVLQDTLKQNIKALAITNADEIIAKEILEIIK